MSDEPHRLRHRDDVTIFVEYGHIHRPTVSLSATAFAQSKFCKDRVEFLLGEIGPERIGEKKLTIHRLPGEKIGEAFLAARADNNVRVRHCVRPEFLSEGLFGNGLGLPRYKSVDCREDLC